MKGLHDTFSDGDNADGTDLEELSSTMESLNTQLDTFATTMSETIPASVASLADTLTPVVELFGAGIPESVTASEESTNKFRDAVVVLGSDLSTTFASAAEDAGGVADAFSAMSGDVVGSLEELRAEIPGVFDAVSSGGSAAAGELDASFTSVISTIEAKWSALLAFVTSAYNNIQAMAASAQSMAQTVSSAKQSKSFDLNLPKIELPKVELNEDTWIGQAAKIAANGMEKLGEFADGVVDRVGSALGKAPAVATVSKADSAVGRFENSINNTVLLANNSGSATTPTKVTINLDGREMATALYEPLINEGKRSGRTLYQK